MAYNYLDQDIQATALIQIHDDDSFFNPTLGHDGYAFNGIHYTNGVEDLAGSPPVPTYASWFTETGGTAYRGTAAPFPTQGLVLLSKVALTILDASTPDLNLWMQFILSDNYAMGNNFSGGLVGFTPQRLAFADGVLSVIYVPDAGSTDITTNMVVTIDFTLDQIYLDVAVHQ